ncbi:unnamed protein product [Thelazia callipaeda]|uniref:Aquaporin n=1 Tax=Thelazia callipaeda TaxID=103827 RepID=A0A158RAR5_THECL|nr:unnamed protein product [Thelazia callipaeda]
MLDSANDFNPFIVAICFYMLVFLIAEFTRKLVDGFVTAGSLLYYFLLEAIATAQMCSCVYENAVIIRHYGQLGFFFAVYSLLFVASTMNRGAFVSPLPPIELFYKNTISLGRFLVTIAGQIVGGFSAYRVARNLWYWSLNLSTDHAVFYKNTSCEIAYKVPFVFVLSFEVIGCFLMRFILCRIPAHSKKLITPAVISAFLTFALLVLGVPGLNPTVASSRLQGCDGLDTSWFILTYWICPAIGWMLSVLNDERIIGSVERKEK